MLSPVLQFPSGGEKTAGGKEPGLPHHGEPAAVSCYDLLPEMFGA